jgi:hypothetical protein
MTIRPTTPNPAHGSGASESGGVARRPPVGGESANPTPSPGPQGADRVEISPAARALQESVAGVGTLDAERLHLVLDRLQSGFYDQPEVLDVVARGVAGDLDRA